MITRVIVLLFRRKVKNHIPQESRLPQRCVRAFFPEKSAETHNFTTLETGEQKFVELQHLQ